MRMRILCAIALLVAVRSTADTFTNIVLPGVWPAQTWWTNAPYPTGLWASNAWLAFNENFNRASNKFNLVDSNANTLSNTVTGMLVQMPDTNHSGYVLTDPLSGNPFLAYTNDGSTAAFTIFDPLTREMAFQMLDEGTNGFQASVLYSPVTGNPAIIAGAVGGVPALAILDPATGNTVVEDINDGVSSIVALLEPNTQRSIIEGDTSATGSWAAMCDVLKNAHVVHLDASPTAPKLSLPFGVVISSNTWPHDAMECPALNPGDYWWTSSNSFPAIIRMDEAGNLHTNLLLLQ